MAQVRSLLAIRILVRTGARPAELRTLPTAQVRWEEQYLVLVEAKGDRQRIEGRRYPSEVDPRMIMFGGRPRWCFQVLATRLGRWWRR